MIIARRADRISALVLAVLLLAGCGAAAPTPTRVPTTGALKGKIVGAGGTPLEGIEGVVGLVCSEDDSGERCLRDFNDALDAEAFIGSICYASQDEPGCVLLWNFSAARVEADGSYAMHYVRPGQYSLLLMYAGPEVYASSDGQGSVVQMYYVLPDKVAQVEVGKTTEYDIVVEEFPDW
jgi:hypothetical protein